MQLANEYKAGEAHLRAQRPRFTRNDARIESVLHRIMLTGDCATVEELAAHAGLSQSRFSHLFTLQTGMTPGTLLRMTRKYRTEHARAREILPNATLRPTNPNKIQGQPGLR